jgi:hypothetical protein
MMRSMSILPTADWLNICLKACSSSEASPAQCSALHAAAVTAVPGIAIATSLADASSHSLHTVSMEHAARQCVAHLACNCLGPQPVHAAQHCFPHCGMLICYGTA